MTTRRTTPPKDEHPISIGRLNAVRQVRVRDEGEAVWLDLLDDAGAEVFASVALTRQAAGEVGSRLVETTSGCAATWHVYATNPIDFGWEWLPLAEDVAADVGRIEAKEIATTHGFGRCDFGSYTFEGFLAAINTAKALALKAGWEGDFRDSTPRVFWLPDPNRAAFIYGFVWKQDNNGETFVVSPFPLPWLIDA